MLFFLPSSIFLSSLSFFLIVMQHINLIPNEKIFFSQKISLFLLTYSEIFKYQPYKTNLNNFTCQIFMNSFGKFAEILSQKFVRSSRLSRLFLNQDASFLPDLINSIESDVGIGFTSEKMVNNISQY